MRIVSVTPEGDVVCRGGGSQEIRRRLFDEFGGRKIALCRRLLDLIEQKRWIPLSAARIPLAICSAELAESLRACDPDVLDVGGVRWGPALRNALRKRYPWPWISGGPETTNASSPKPLGGVEPFVSIVLPTYNGVKYLRESIESCLNQTHRNLELLVVDDGSTADVRGILSRFSDARLRYLRHERNQGIAAGLNTGFRNSRGEFLTWTSDDNYYESHAIAEMLGFLSRYPDVDFVYAESYVVNDEGVVTQLMQQRPSSSLRINNYVGACFLYKRCVYERVGEYRPVLLTEDYDYWIRVARTCRMQRLFKLLYYYREHPASLTGRYSSQEVDDRVTEVKRMNRFGSRNNR